MGRPSVAERRVDPQSVASCGAAKYLQRAVMEVTSMTTKGRPARDAYLWTTADLRTLKRLA
jgi:hypothetical protein